MYQENNLKPFYLVDYLDAPESQLPKKKYCDVTGYETNYRDKSTGLYFKDHAILQYLKNLSKSEKDSYIGVRNPLRLIKYY